MYTHWDFFKTACVRTIEMPFPNEFLARKFRLQLYRYRNKLRKGGNMPVGFDMVEIVLKQNVLKAGMTGFELQNMMLLNGMTIEEMFKDVETEYQERERELEQLEPTKPKRMDSETAVAMFLESANKKAKKET